MYLERNTHADLNQSGRRKYKFFYFKLKNVTSYFFFVYTCCSWIFWTW